MISEDMEVDMKTEKWAQKCMDNLRRGTYMKGIMDEDKKVDDIMESEIRNVFHD